jgi:hypothetical protein
MNTPRTDICRPEDREAVLTERQRMKMACSAHSYVRGSTLKFYEWLGLSHSAIFTAGSARLDLRRLPSGKLGPCGRRQGPSEDCYPGPGTDCYRKSCPRSHSPTAIRGSDLPGVTTALMLEHVSTHPENPGSSISTSTSTGSPSSALVEETNPKS